MTPLLSDRGQLALAIHRRDFEAAEQVLAMMAARNDGWAQATQAAKRVVCPPEPLRSPVTLAFPMPGARVGAVLGDDPTQRVRKRDPMYQPAGRAA